MSTPALYTFTLYQGQTWQNILALKDSAGVAQNLTGYTARMQIRESLDATTPVLELTTENGRLTITPLTGQIAILVPATVMAALDLDFETQSWVYDLEIVSSDVTPLVTRIMQGAVIVVPEVTR